MMKGITWKVTSAWLFVSLSVQVWGQLTDITEVFDKNCEVIYENELRNKSELNFNLPIHGISCDTSAGMFYHCVPDYPDREKYIEFCGDWIWMESGKCPAIYSVRSIIHPFTCDVNNTKGCPDKQYQSHLYYKNPGCFLIKKASSSKGTVKNQRSSGLPGYAIGLIAFGVIIAISASVIASIFFVLFWRRRHFTPRNEEDGFLLNQPGRFKHRRAINKATECLNVNKQVVITGKPGTGKKGLLEDLKMEFQELECAHVRTEYAHFNLQENTAYFLIISHYWLMDHGGLKGLNSEMENVGEGSIKVITATEKFMQKNKYMEEFNNCTIDLSGDFELTSTEKQEVIRLRCEADGVSGEDFTMEHQEEAVGYECRHYGFLYLIDLLFKKKEFDNPKKFLTNKDVGSRRFRNDSILG